MRKIIVTLLVLLVGVVPAFAQDSGQQQALPIVAESLLARANQSLNASEYDSALRDLSLFILLNPTFSPAYFGRAQAYVGLGNYDDAGRDVNRAIDTAADSWSTAYNASLYTLRGEIDQQQQQFDAALSDFNQSISLEPSTEALVSRGMLYLFQDDAQAALTDLDSAVELDSGSAQLYIYRGLVHARLNDAPATGADYLQFFSTIQASATSHAEIQSGQAVTIQIDQGTVVVLPFTAKAHQYVGAFAAARGGTIDPLMVLIDRQGNPLAGDDDSGGNNSALLQDVEIPADGQYALVIGHSLGGFSGQVLLQFQLADAPSQ